MMFFVASAPNSGRINLSPKGMDAFRILSGKRVIYLDVTGSGNETASIVRLYGHGRTIHPCDPQWSEYLAMFPSTPGLRQIMEIYIDSALTSCGYAVPKLESLAEREAPRCYWEKRSEGTSTCTIAKRMNAALTICRPGFSPTAHTRKVGRRRRA
jgi:hypothetical protein